MPKLAPLDKTRALLLAEMVARVTKNLLRKKMRRLFRKLKLPSGTLHLGAPSMDESGIHCGDFSSPAEEPFRRLITKVVNRLLHHRSNDKFWQKVRTSLITKFGQSALSPEECDGLTLHEVIKVASLEPILLRRCTWQEDFTSPP